MTTDSSSALGWPAPPHWPPEIPSPRRPFEPSPGPPHPTTYPPVPTVYEIEPSRLAKDLLDRLLERRILLAAGVLDEATANELAARLMFLDGSGDERIELRYSCHDGELGAAIALADTVELLGVELRATATGAVGGPAVLPFAVANRRIAHPYATFVLRGPEREVRGRVTDVLAEAAHHARLVDDMHRRLGEATGRPTASIEADFAARRLLTAQQAHDYGLVDEVAVPRRSNDFGRPTGVRLFFRRQCAARRTPIPTPAQPGRWTLVRRAVGRDKG